MGSVRDALVADRSLTGTAWCAAYTGLVDVWLRELLASAYGDRPGVALVAVGGYGRGELCPASDIDVMLVHHRSVDGAALADAIWYPIWDEGLHLGHRVSTVKQVLRLAADDLDTATALLSTRHVAGDASLTEEVADRAVRQWRDASTRWIQRLAASVDERHDQAGEIAFRLEPDLKEGRGGMRDVHALQWAEAAKRVLFDTDDDALRDAYDVLLRVRVELHRSTGRASNVLTLQDQPEVAAALGCASPDELMVSVARAGRTIAWTSDDAWRRVGSSVRGPRGRSNQLGHRVALGVVERDGEIHLDEQHPSEDPLAALRIAVASATRDLPIERTTLDRLRVVAVPLPEPWPVEARRLFEELLAAGRPTIAVVEALDHHGVWSRLVPEWDDVRARPQHNPYHRFTVDRHTLETVANAAERAGGVDRPDLLVLAALLHDLGKGHGDDHVVRGMELATRIGMRMGYPVDDIDAVRSLVQHHLLLVETATRRELDEATVNHVARAVGSLCQLRLLAALTESDALATGPSAWTPWKAQLVAELVDSVAARFGATPEAKEPRSFPTTDDLALLERGGRSIAADGDTITVATEDRPGVFSRVAGVLALRGLDVVEAMAHSDEEGRALSRFRVHDPRRDVTPWDRVVADLDAALDGRLAIPARLAERERSYAPRQRTLTAPPASVTFHNDAATESTVIDVAAPDGVGLLYRITRALSDLDLDIRSARVETLGTHVVDSFYVRDHAGSKIEDRALLGEIELAVLHAIATGTSQR